MYSRHKDSDLSHFFLQSSIVILMTLFLSTGTNVQCKPPNSMSKDNIYTENSTERNEHCQY